MGTEDWNKASVVLPEDPPRGFTVGRIEFVVAGKRHIGSYHINGCFYADGVFAPTPYARSRYEDLGSIKNDATHWRFADDVPSPV